MKAEQKPWRYKKVTELGRRFENYELWSRESPPCLIGEVGKAYGLMSKAPHWEDVNDPSRWDWTRDTVAQRIYDRWRETTPTPAPTGRATEG